MSQQDITGKAQAQMMTAVTPRGLTHVAAVAASCRPQPQPVGISTGASQHALSADPYVLLHSRANAEAIAEPVQATGSAALTAAPAMVAAFFGLRDQSNFLATKFQVLQTWLASCGLVEASFCAACISRQVFVLKTILGGTSNATA